MSWEARAYNDGYRDGLLNRDVDTSWRGTPQWEDYVQGREAGRRERKRK